MLVLVLVISIVIVIVLSVLRTTAPSITSKSTITMFTALPLDPR
ncbi:MAG TPA: hypothetical protein VEQ65_10920 [Opitutus sp.]|nr:hypothetical protein [Opitutus sp.]